MKSTNLLIMLVAVLVSGLFIQGCQKPQGCTDASAVNFDPEAEEDDGTCIFDTDEMITDDGNGTGTVTWTKDKTYILDGFVFVNEGQTLTIEAGTVIKGNPGTGVNASALIVARGGTIRAEGTATEPIIFTGLDDDPTDPNDIAFGTNGLWGGLVILGNARLNTVPGEQAIEGIPTTETRGLYGGTNDADNSGILKYVSIRYGGSDIGSGDEINGLTLGGVGSGTEIDYVEVYSNFDDGVEWFGGNVDAKHLVVSFCGDDSYDYDQGWRGRVQYGFTIAGENTGDRGGEHDGGTDPEAGTPFATPIFSNCTYIGSGIAAGNRALTFRDNAGGEYHNSIFLNWGKGADIEYLQSADDSWNQYANLGNLTIMNSHFYSVVSTDASLTFDQVFTVASPDTTIADAVLDSLGGIFANAMMDSNNGNNTILADPGVVVNYGNSVTFNPQPTLGAALTGGVQPSTLFFDQVSFKGAFDGATNWLTGWTALSQNGHIQ